MLSWLFSFLFLSESFINGQAIIYNPKYYEEWVRNNAQVNERNKTYNKARNANWSKNFERKKENIVINDMLDQ